MEDDSQVSCQRRNVTFDKGARISETKNCREDAGDKCGFGEKKVGKAKIPEVPKPETTRFPYSSTKLRADAPPFTPECMASLMKAEVPGEESYFVNMELNSPEDSPAPEPDYPTDTSKQLSRDLAKVENHEPDTPNLQASSSRTIPIITTEDQDEIETEPIIVSVTRPQHAPEEFQDNPTRERKCARFINTQFLADHKIRIVVVVASFIISFVLLLKICF